MTTNDDSGVLEPISDQLPPIDEVDTSSEIKYFFLPSGLPFVIGDDPEIFQRVQSELGFSTYYLLAHSRKVEDIAGKHVPGVGFIQAHKVNHDIPNVFKVVRNMVGTSVHIAPEEDAGLIALQPQAYFALPKIPWDLVQKMDQFFRLVADKLGTESIVVLTFDPSAKDEAGNYTSDGWGLVVPLQENTAGHCNYNQESVVEEKDDDHFIVGTAHSHPNMAAFASGTDHHDQRDFDGIHITYGWRKNINGGATEYHIELQMGGSSWKLNPDQVFADMPAAAVPKDVEKWADLVKARKQTNVVGTGSHGSSYTPPNPRSDVRDRTNTSAAFKNGPSQTPGFSKGFAAAQAQWASVLAEEAMRSGAPDARVYVIISEVIEDFDTGCPVCGCELNKNIIENHRCPDCWNYIVRPGTSLQKLYDERKKLRFYVDDLVANPPENSKPLVFWRRTKTADNKIAMTTEVVENRIEATPLA